MQLVSCAAEHVKHVLLQGVQSNVIGSMKCVDGHSHYEVDGLTDARGDLQDVHWLGFGPVHVLQPPAQGEHVVAVEDA